MRCLARGYNKLYDPEPEPTTPALCWAHARRQFFELVDIAANARRGKKAAVKRMDALFDIEREINRLSAEERLAAHKEGSASQFEELKAWLREERGLGRQADRLHAETLGSLYILHRGWPGLCLTDNAAERTLRGFALGRKSWLFAGSERAAAMATLVATAKLNDIDPQGLARRRARPHR